MRMMVKQAHYQQQKDADDMAKGRTKSGRLKKGYRILKGGRVVKAKGKK